MHLPIFPRTCLLLVCLANTITAWRCPKNEHTLYRATCCDSVTALKRGKFEGTDCYQPFPVVAKNMTVKNEYTCTFQGTEFGFPGCCKDKKGNVYKCQPVVE